MALFNNTDYSNKMESKSQQYKALIASAEMWRRDYGKPSKKEAKFYEDAAYICEEIRDMNLSQRAVYSKWAGRAQVCHAKVAEIINELMPAPVVTPEPKPAPVIAPAPAPAAHAAPATLNSEPSGAITTEGKTGGAVTTASGFVTYNAMADVPAETIEKWHKGKPNHNFDAVTGMEEEKKLLNKRIRNMEMPLTAKTIALKEQKCLLFYGLPGTGKTFVIEGFISELMERGYQYLYLTHGDIHASKVGVSEKTIEVAFREAIDHAPCIIFIDEFEAVCVNRKDKNAVNHEKNLTVSFLKAFDSIKASEKQVILIGATNYPHYIDSAMHDRIVPVQVTLPVEKARIQYFERQLKNITLEEPLTFEFMGEVTEGFSYRDMEKIVAMIQEQIMDEAIEQNGVYDDQNKMDFAATDSAASKAVAEGQIKLTQEWFDKIFQGYRPSDKSANMESLQEFERNFAKSQEG